MFRQNAGISLARDFYMTYVKPTSLCANRKNMLTIADCSVPRLFRVERVDKGDFSGHWST